MQLLMFVFFDAFIVTLPVQFCVRYLTAPLDYTAVLCFLLLETQLEVMVHLYRWGGVLHDGMFHVMQFGEIDVDLVWACICKGQPH